MVDGINWLNVPEDVADVWLAALNDAEISWDEAALLLHPVLPDNGQLAVYLGIDRHVTPELPQAVLADLDRIREQLSGRHAVTLMTDDRPIEMDAALLRHELQHARQLTTDPRLWDLAGLCEDVVRHAPADSGRLYNRIPTEQDANARFTFEPLGATRVTELQAGDGGGLTMVHANQWSAKLCVRARFLRATRAGDSGVRV